MTSTATRPHSTSCLFGSARPKRRIRGLQFYTSRTSVFLGGYKTSKHPLGRESLTPNRGKIWCWIQAGRQVVSAPARFWERAALVLERRVAAFAGVVQVNNLQRVFCGLSLFSPHLGWLLNMPCRAMEAGGANGCQG